ncbi:hypothetical protein EJ110_NYTH20971 [Nymphaea thermarum]|nr:hypothetical protein EJ110_NYTH20971 [Nymphaea thermarum]
MDEELPMQVPPQQPLLPPGFRLHPMDEELVVHYLKRKASSAPLPVAIIGEVDLYKFDPWELPCTELPRVKLVEVDLAMMATEWTTSSSSVGWNRKPGGSCGGTCMGGRLAEGRGCF